MHPATLPFKLRASSGPQFHHTFEEQQGCRSHLVLGLAVHLPKSLSQAVDTTGVLVLLWG